LESSHFVMLQGRLFGAGTPAIHPGARFVRRSLDERSWVDVARDFLHGADTLFDHLRVSVEWSQGRRWMYDREVADPRLSHWYEAGEALPHDALVAIRDALGARYGVRFGAIGLNYYRDGRDSVAFHRDRELQHLSDTLIAIVTLGSQRPFLIRPRSRGASIDLSPASGDLLVMGGACQLAFEHGVPKVVHAGPRISVTYRWARRPDPPAVA
jgi:alkylated DNA repair dioxygenase AlkB